MSPRDLFLHLRLHWQLMLLPLFLWGFLMSAGSDAPRLVLTGQFWLVLLVFHVLFYGGATALNSYYDRDEEGPVGGLWNPPKVTRTLLWFSAGIQILGLILMAFVSPPLFILSLVMGVVGNAYSHPATRLKARPWTSLLAVSIFQGMGGAAAGWLFARPDWGGLLSTTGLLTLLSASLVITGFYPLTQIYQREQDRKQGVISFAVQWGEKCFALAIACYLAAAGLMGFLIWRSFSHCEAVVVAVGLVALAGIVLVWWRQFDDSHVRRNYLWMMRLGYLMTGGFLGFIGYQLAQGF